MKNLFVCRKICTPHTVAYTNFKRKLKCGVLPRVTLSHGNAVLIGLRGVLNMVLRGLRMALNMVLRGLIWSPLCRELWAIWRPIIIWKFQSDQPARLDLFLCSNYFLFCNNTCYIFLYRSKSQQNEIIIIYVLEHFMFYFSYTKIQFSRTAYILKNDQATNLNV